jgi:hypothetical protein
MRRNRELMDRLAAADPLRAGEQLSPEDRREADALLTRLLATPVEPAAAPRRLRRRVLAVAGAACAALAALAAIDLLDSDTSGPAVVDKAVAAVNRAGVVYHVLEFATSRQSPPLEGAAADAPHEAVFESWYTSDGRRHRKTFAMRDGQKGRLVEDFAGRRHPGRASGTALLWSESSNTIGESGWGRVGSDLPILDSSEGPGVQLRALQEQGRLRVDGTTSVDGRRAYRLVSDKVPVLGDQVEIEFTVDAESYLPLSQRVSSELEGGRKLDVLTRYRVYERLPLDDETSGLLALDPHPGAKCSEFAHELTEERDLGFPNPCK